MTCVTRAAMYVQDVAKSVQTRYMGKVERPPTTGRKGGSRWGERERKKKEASKGEAPSFSNGTAEPTHASILGARRAAA